MTCYLELNRLYFKDKYTIGKLFVNGEYFCDTLEPSLSGDHRCITPGLYDIDLHVVSPKFYNKTPYKTLCNGCVPRLVRVPGRSGVLLHIGNSFKDTTGCILVGLNKKVGSVLYSTATFTKLYKHISSDFFNNVVISINNVL